MWRWYLNNGFEPYNYYMQTSRRCWWNKYQHQHLACTWRVKMKGEGSIKGEGGTERKGWRSRKKYYSNQEPKLYSNLQEIYKNWSSWTMPRTIFFTLNQYIFIFLSFKPTLFVIQIILVQFFNSLSTNSLFWACWAWVHSSFGRETQIWSLHI